MIKPKVLIKVSDLKPGMFVEELDRPWLETPYVFQGALMKSQADIDELAHYCQHVYISVEEQTVIEPPAFKPPLGSTSASSSPPEKVYRTSERAKRPFVQSIPDEESTTTPFHGKHIYIDKTPIEKELPKAKKAYKTAQVLISQIKQELNTNLTLNISAAKDLVNVIVSSIVNNPDAMLLLNSFKSAHGEEYNRALNVSIHLITFGRHLCLPAEELVLLGLGGLLMDIGEVKLANSIHDAKEIFDMPKDSPMHVKYGEQILSNIPGIPEEVVQITLQHHEREDGSGYPNGLCGNQIITYARMAAIVDCYERLVTKGIGSYTEPLTPFEGLQMLWDWTRRWLNATLVQRFAHSIGLFPVGSLVELNSGEVALVLSHSRSNRLRPKVMLILNSDKVRYSSPLELDLGLNPLNSNGVVYEIKTDLEANAYNIDPKKFYI